MAANPLLEPIQQRGVAIIDGGLGTELEARGHDLGDALWSARLLRDVPEAITAVHTDYLDAGVDCIVTSSYQASFDGFQRAGIERVEGEALLRRSVELALEARGDRSALVAASVGPYGAALADGAEFTGDYDRDEDQLFEWHRERFAVLASAGADLVACETVPSFAEARALARLIEATPDLWGWISFSCRDEQHISDGTPLRECAEHLDTIARVAAVGINCTAPRHIRGLIESAVGATSKPILVYPNAGHTWHAASMQWVGAGDETDLAEDALQWCALGASAIGGCCGTRPEHIRRIRERLSV
ncbi:MAG: homocysteine S-methyltransferase [Planctomycetota bacterium]|jgi:homocysteine S-methyltransferase